MVPRILGSNGGEEWASENDPGQWSEVSAEGLALRGLKFGLRCKTVTCQFPGAGFPATPSAGIWQGDFDQLARARDILVTIRDEVAPTITTQKGVPAGWRRDNVLPVSFTAADNVGVKGLAVWIDGTRVDSFARTCFVSERNALGQPCAGSSPPEAPNLEVSGLADGAHKVEFVATDIVDNTTSETFTLLTDHTAPGAPRDLALVAGFSWRKSNQFGGRVGEPGRRQVRHRWMRLSTSSAQQEQRR